MAERSRTRSVTQRRFELTAEPADSAKETAPDRPQAFSPAVSPLPIPREPADTELRERQMRWVKARLRFEARAGASDAPQGSK